MALTKLDIPGLIGLSRDIASALTGARAMARPVASNTVTLMPFLAATVANSRPMKPAPIDAEGRPRFGFSGIAIAGHQSDEGLAKLGAELRDVARLAEQALVKT